jgi:multisubunit Na+/H+ antiporter MnhF subunit
MVACGRLAEDPQSTVSVIALNATMTFVITIVALLATCYEGKGFTLR